MMNTSKPNPETTRNTQYNMGSITTNKPSKFSKQSNTKSKQNWVLDICRVEKQIYDKEQKNKKKYVVPSWVSLVRRQNV